MIYLASPYSDPDSYIREYRFKQACRISAKLMMQGHLIFSPIAHTHPIALAGDLPLGFDYWERFDTEMLTFCSELWVLMLAGWEDSKGIRAELHIMQELGKPIAFLSPSGEFLPKP